MIGVTRPQAYEIYKNEYLVFSNIELVTITSVDDPNLEIATAWAQPLPFAHEVLKIEIGEVDKRTRGWILFDVSLGGNVPRRGWVLTQADGTAWSLKDGFKQMRWGTQWHGEGTQEVPDDFEAVA